MLVNGILVKDKTRFKNINEAIKEIDHKTKIYKSTYDNYLTRGHYRSFRENKSKYKKFYLLDKNSIDYLIVEPGKEAKTWNLPQKRKMQYSLLDFTKGMEELHEKLSFIAYEGSSLTLIGLVSYDIKED